MIKSPSGALGCVLALVLSFASAPAALAQGRATTLVVATPSDPPHLDPSEAAGVQYDITYHVYRRLYHFDRDMTPQFDAVHSEKISADERVWTLELRRDIVFHDGTPFNAEAVKYTIERMKDPKRAAPQAVLFEPVKAVRVVGEYTVELETQTPFASLRNNLAHPNAGIVSPTADRKLGGEFGRRPVSAGPYSLAEWVSGDRIILKRFDKYVGPKPFYDTIVFRAVPEPQTRLAMVQRGEADVAIRMPASFVPLVERTPSVQVIRIDGTRILYMWFNLDKSPTNDPRVRQALNLAINREAIGARVAFGAGGPVNSLMERVISYSTPVGQLEYNPEKAKTLLQEAGAAGQALTLVASQGYWEYDRQSAEAVAGFLRAVGLNVNLQVIEDAGAYLQAMTRREHHMGVVGWSGSTADPDHYLRRQLWGKNAGKPWNFSGYKNARVDQLIEQGSRAFEPRARAPIYAEIQKIIWNDMPWMPLMRVTAFAFARADIEGIVVYPNSQAHVYFDARPKGK